MVRRQLRLRYRLALRRGRRFMLHNVLHADDPPRKLALGLAIGMFVMLTPTMGFQMILVVFLAWLLRANKVVGVPLVWISNPATTVAIYYPCYVVGRVLLGHERIRMDWWRELAHPPSSWWPAVQFYWQRMMEIFAPLWVGCLVVGLLVALVTYYVSLYSICWYRMRRWGQLTRPIPPASDRVATR